MAGVWATPSPQWATPPASATTGPTSCRICSTRSRARASSASPTSGSAGRLSATMATVRAANGVLDSVDRGKCLKSWQQCQAQWGAVLAQVTFFKVAVCVELGSGPCTPVASDATDASDRHRVPPRASPRRPHSHTALRYNSGSEHRRVSLLALACVQGAHRRQMGPYLRPRPGTEWSREKKAVIHSVFGSRVHCIGRRGISTRDGCW